MRFGRRDPDAPGDAASMTAFIDVIFQLVLFFVFTLKFVAFEAYLDATLPKGPGDGPLVPQVTLEIERSSDGASIVCTTPTYVPADGSAPIDGYVFPEAPGARTVVRPDGVAAVETTVAFPRRGGTRTEDVRFEGRVPDFRAVESYLAERKRFHESVGAKRPMVTVRFRGEVPWQIPATLLDICTRLEIEDFALGAVEAMD